nr:immunoglobulin heavy chain junction region [Macaca mulatta]
CAKDGPLSSGWSRGFDYW